MKKLESNAGTTKLQRATKSKNNTRTTALNRLAVIWRVSIKPTFRYTFVHALFEKKSNILILKFVLPVTRNFNVYHHSGPASVAQLDAPSDWRPGGRGFNRRQGRQHSVVEIDHEIFSTVIFSLPLIQEEQLSVSGERMCTMLVNRFKD